MQPRGADAVVTVFVFLDLLESDGLGTGQVYLGKSFGFTKLAKTFADMNVNEMGMRHRPERDPVDLEAETPA